ncbi:MAG: phosphomannomutase/phosphoglucomutase [Candidatus Liptonbacteria bacterium]
MDYGIFKAYDIRGVYPSEIDERTVYAIAQAYAKYFSPKKVVLGRDVRLSGQFLWQAAVNGFIDHGVDVLDIGIITTDMLYFAAAACDVDGGLSITASHNPRDYNGIKMVLRGAVAISSDSGLREIKNLVEQNYKYQSRQPGRVTQKEIMGDYLTKCLEFVDLSELKRLKVVLNGMNGPVLRNLRAANLPIEIIPLNEEMDGSFPKGQPDPLQEKNRLETAEAIIREKPDFGVAWDADADRFFLFDENGRYIPGYYITAFLGEYFSAKNPGAKVINDIRLTWAVRDRVSTAGGIALENKAGHTFIKERMRKEGAVFGGEMSGHYYFRDYFYADNGLIPFLLMLEIVSVSGKKVSELFEPFFQKYFISGEINTALSDFEKAKGTILKIESLYPDTKKEHIDGLSLEEEDWRANIRPSNTEPLLRLNVEAKSAELMKQKTDELLGVIRAD